MLNDDLILLQEYARHNSGEAFAALVSRYVNLIYSVALRQVRDPQLTDPAATNLSYRFYRAVTN